MRKAIIALILVGLLALITAVPVFAAAPPELGGPLCHANDHSGGRALDGFNHQPGGSATCGLPS